MNKGSFVSKELAGIILPIIIAPVILVNAGILKSDVIDPNQQNVVDSLQELQSSRHVVLGEGGYPKSTFRQMAVYNMLTAANCKLVGAVQHEGDPGSADYVNYYTDNDFETLKWQMNVENNCVGSLSDDLTPRWTSYIQLDSAATQSGKDFEGRQGTITFNVSEQFVVNEDGDSDEGSEVGGELIKINLEGLTDDVSVDNLGWWGDAQPDFWVGDRVSAFVPAGIYGPSSDANGWSEAHTELYSDNVENVEQETYGGSEVTYAEPTSGFTTEWIRDDSNAEDEFGLYSYRIRMKNVPVVFEDNAYFNNGDEGDNAASIGVFEGFVRNAQWIFCEGAEGYVQSNAHYMNFGGEATSGDAKIENSVYPLVHLTEDETSCLDSFEASSEDYYAPFNIGGNSCTWDQLSTTVEAYGLTYECLLHSVGNQDFPMYEPDTNTLLNHYYETRYHVDQESCPDNTQTIDITGFYDVFNRNQANSPSCPSCTDEEQRSDEDTTSVYYGSGSTTEQSFDMVDVEETYSSSAVISTHTDSDINGDESDGIGYHLENFEGVGKINGTIDIGKGSDNDAPGLVSIYVGTGTDERYKLGLVNWKRDKLRYSVRENTNVNWAGDVESDGERQITEDNEPNNPFEMTLEVTDEEIRLSKGGTAISKEFTYSFSPDYVDITVQDDDTDSNQEMTATILEPWYAEGMPPGCPA